MSLFAELKRRNVFRVGIAYAVVAWLVMQVADVMIDNIGAPPWLFKFIVLVLAIGLPVALVFAWAFEMTPEGLKREKDVDRSQSITRQTGRKLDRMIIGVMGLVIAYLVIDRFVLNEPPQAAPAAATESAQPAEAMTAASGKPSIAVLPFVNMSNDPDNEYFSDGLTETLLNMLAQLPGLQVAARTSSFAFKGQNKSIPEIAEALGVANVLEGSVQKAGDRVRVTAQLIRAADGFHVWSQNYTRPLEDVFAIQDEIATDVATALDESLLGGGETVHGVATANVAAYDLYLKAMEQQAIFSFGSMASAESLFKQALAADPGFIDAKVGLARNYLMMNDTGLLDRAETELRLKPILEQLRAQDPDNPLARACDLEWRLRSPQMMDDATRQGLVDEYRKLLPQISTETYLRSKLAQYLRYLPGHDYAGSLEVLQAGLLVDPLSTRLHNVMANTYRRMKEFDKAREQLERSLELDPRDPGTYTRMAQLAEDQGDLPGSLDWRRRATEVDPQDHELVGGITYLLYALNLPEEGDRWFQRAAALAPGADAVTVLAVDRAIGRGDWDGVMQVAAPLVAKQISFRQGAFATALFGYQDAALALGRNRQAYDFLVGVRPEVADFDQPPPDLHALLMRGAAITLMTGFADPAETRSRWEALVTQAEASGFHWRDDPLAVVEDHIMRRETQQAIEVALNDDLSQPFATWPNRADIYRLPLYSEITADPAVAARLAELDRQKARVREQVSEMLQRPEWQE